MSQEKAKRTREALAELERRQEVASKQIEKFVGELKHLKRIQASEYLRQTLRECKGEIVEKKARIELLNESNARLRTKISKSKQEVGKLTRHFREKQAITFPQVLYIYW